MIGIGDECKGQVVFRDELLVRFLVVYADPDNFVAPFQELIVIVAQVTGFGGTSRGIILGIEIKDHFLSLQIAERNSVAVLVLPFKYRGFISFL